MPNETTHQLRRNRVAELIRQQRFVTLSQLTRKFDISESTARRDLEHLEQQGVATRTHGGAYYTRRPHEWLESGGTSSENYPAKQAIARVAAGLIAEGEPIILDGGSTTLEIARHLVGRDVHIITNSLPIANLLAVDPRSDLILIGGNICARSGASRGPLADAMLRSVRVRKAILGVASVYEDGLYNDNLLLVETERAMIAAADETIIVADSSKFGRRSISHLCSLDRVGSLVVDEGLPQAWRRRLTQSGINVIIAELTSTDELAPTDDEKNETAAPSPASHPTENDTESGDNT